MKKIICSKHGETEAVSIDDLLLRYECKNCKDNNNLDDVNVENSSVDDTYDN